MLYNRSADVLNVPLHELIINTDEDITTRSCESRLTHLIWGRWKLNLPRTKRIYKNPHTVINSSHLQLHSVHRQANQQGR